MAHIPAASYPICPFCSEHIELEKAHTDDKGKAVHEECYVAHIIEQNRFQMGILLHVLAIRSPSRRQQIYK